MNKRLLASSMGILAACFVFAQSPAIVNWSAPATFTPAHKGGVTTQSTSLAAPFIALTPCRAYDSRPSHGGPGALANATPRLVPLTGGSCGVLTGNLIAVSVNITVFDILGATGNGVFRVDTVAPPNTAWINYPPSETQRSNAGAVAVDASSQIVVQVNQGAGSVDFTIDVNGYYALNVTGTNNAFVFESDNVGTFGVMRVQNTSTSGSDAHGLTAYTGSSGGGSAGAYGQALATTGRVFGLKGLTNSTTKGTAGVYGIDSSGDPGLAGTVLNASGVYGASSTGYGVFGVSTDPGGGVGVKGVDLDSAGNLATAGYLGETSGDGVLGVSFATAGVAYGVRGNATPAAGVVGYGVFGLDNGTSGNSAGVNGLGPHGFADNFLWATAGVRGDDGTGGVGVLGTSGSAGAAIIGATFDTTGNTRTTEGILGAPGPTNYGVFAFIGTIGCNGCAKLFVEPHPTDPTRVIRFVSIEANEALTAFRGTGHTVGGRATIEVPAEFRAVSEQDKLTVQLTPIGALATMAVESKNLSQIAVLSSQDVDFDYEIHGVHLGYRDFQSVHEGIEYAPHSADDRMPAAWPEHVKQRLIANGTYNADGTVNMATAERVGWAQSWRDAEEKARSEARRVPLDQN